MQFCERNRDHLTTTPFTNYRIILRKPWLFKVVRKYSKCIVQMESNVMLLNLSSTVAKIWRDGSTECRRFPAPSLPKKDFCWKNASSQSRQHWARRVNNVTCTERGEKHTYNMTYFVFL